MIKLLLSGVWICAITLASSYAAASWTARSGAVAGPEDMLSGLNYEKTGALSIPMVKNGGVQGYVVAQFVFTADAGVLKDMSVPPGPFILDEAFKAIYADERIDFDHLEKFDIASLTKAIVQNVNARFKTKVIEDLLVEQFTYVSKDEVRAQAGETGQGPVLTADGATGMRDEEKAAPAEAAASAPAH